ncbi:hypothetical protein M076_1026 [Bacteroides fragilis str. 2-F-2 |uniref:Uncharacterized protein n=1 Tax=Bacteroides fragilis str. 2-F-2 \|nr:hypothetical protein M077_1085 [Bacteroides fragilis str. 2-F-2 \
MMKITCEKFWRLKRRFYLCTRKYIGGQIYFSLCPIYV